MNSVSNANQCQDVIRAGNFPAFVNENVVRWNAFLTVLTLAAAFWVTPWAFAVLVYDFASRVLFGPRWSLFARSGALVLGRLGVKPRMIAGAPKRFAAGIGFSLSALSGLLLLGGHVEGWYVAGLIVVFATLEAAFAFCAGCVLYQGLGRLGIVDECPTCIR
jgi:hypothetical protein